MRLTLCRMTARRGIRITPRVTPVGWCSLIGIVQHAHDCGNLPVYNVGDLRERGIFTAAQLQKINRIRNGCKRIAQIMNQGAR